MYIVMNSLVQRLSPSKQGGGEPGNIERKAVDFQSIIIHVNNAGGSHFSNNCHVV